MKNRLPAAFLAAILIAVLLAGCAPASIPQTGGVNAPGGSDLQGSPTAATPGGVTPSPAAPTASQNSAPQASPSVEASPSPTGGAPSTTAAAPSQGTVVYTLVADQSEARYRVREQLAEASLPNDAIGRTKEVSGSVTIHPDGTIDSAASKFTVNLASLQTDRAMRDNYVRRNVLNTSQYPEAVFMPTAVTGLPSPLPASGEVQFQMAGNLTIRDVTRPVTWDVKGKVENGQAVGTATTTFTFEDFQLTQPRVPVVLSVEDHITLEVDVTLQPSEG